MTLPEGWYEFAAFAATINHGGGGGHGNPIAPPNHIARRASGSQDIGSPDFGLTLTAGASIAVGSLLTLIVSGDNGFRSINSVTDTRGNVWQIDINQNTGFGFSLHVASCIVTNPYSNGDVVTAHFNAGQGWGGFIEEWSGIRTHGNYVDTFDSFHTASNSFSFSDSVTTSSAIDLLLGLNVFNATAVYTPDAGANQITTVLVPSFNFTLFNGQLTVDGAWKVTTATGLYTYSANYGVGKNTQYGIVAYKGGR